MYNRWLVLEHYYGKFVHDSIICTTRSISDAAFVVNGLLLQHAGRPYIYRIEKCSDDYNEYLDDIIQDNFFMQYDYTEYVEGINCLDYGEGGCYHG